MKRVRDTWTGVEKEKTEASLEVANRTMPGRFEIIDGPAKKKETKSEKPKEAKADDKPKPEKED